MHKLAQTSWKLSMPLHCVTDCKIDCNLNWKENKHTSSVELGDATKADKRCIYRITHLNKEHTTDSSNFSSKFGLLTPLDGTSYQHK